jgi:hypothetical protein
MASAYCVQNGIPRYLMSSRLEQQALCSRADPAMPLLPSHSASDDCVLSVTPAKIFFTFETRFGHYENR